MKSKTIILTAVVILVAVIYPGPLPIKHHIMVTSEQAGIRFYWRPSGLAGIFGDDPWVYAVQSSNKGQSEVIKHIWADTPCDGVERLSKILSLTTSQCHDML